MGFSGDKTKKAVSSPITKWAVLRCVGSYGSTTNLVVPAGSNTLQGSEEVSGDITEFVPFETCTFDTANHKCAPVFEFMRWQGLDDGNLIGEDEAVLIDSKMICSTHREGLITIVDGGQEPGTGDDEDLGYEFLYDWAKEGLPSTQFITPEFMEKVIDISNKLQINPDDLMAVMAFESWCNPAQKNPNSSATGLIQFMENTAESLGTTTEELAKMSGVQQLDYVYDYYQSYTGKLNDIEDVYMVTLWPKAVGKPSDYAVFTKGDDFYEGNSGLDLNEDGIVTKEEATQTVLERRQNFE